MKTDVKQETKRTFTKEEIAAIVSESFREKRERDKMIDAILAEAYRKKRERDKMIDAIIAEAFGKKKPVADDAEFEKKHPREEGGQFAEQSGSSYASGSSEKEVKNKESIMHANNVKEFKVGDPEEPIHDLVDKTKEWNKSLTGQQKNSISNYSSHFHENINFVLRGGKDDGDWTDHVNSIADAISKYELKEDVKVFRAVNYKTVFGDIPPETLIGRVEKDKGFMSSSFDINKMGDITKNFPHVQKSPVILEIDVPKGIGRGAYIFDHSTTPEEQEFLIQRGSKYKIYGMDKTKNGILILKAELK